MTYREIMEYNVTLPQDTFLRDEINRSGDILLEMVNLSAEETGLDGGMIFISTAMASHGPRVKFFLKAGSNQKSFSVSIARPPVVVANSLPKKALARYAPQVIDWVSLNYTSLDGFWRTGTTMTSAAQQAAFFQSLQKI